MLCLPAVNYDTMSKCDKYAMLIVHQFIFILLSLYQGIKWIHEVHLWYSRDCDIKEATKKKSFFFSFTYCNFVFIIHVKLSNQSTIPLPDKTISPNWRYINNKLLNYYYNVPGNSNGDVFMILSHLKPPPMVDARLQIIHL